MVRAFFRAPTATLGLLVAILLLATAALAPAFFTERATVVDVLASRQPPGAEHLLGTDGLGRDLLFRLLVASQASLGLALLAAVLGTLIGIPLGALAALLAPRVRAVALRAIDALFAFPFILVAIFLVAILGAGPIGAILGVGIPLSFGMARITSSLVMGIGGRDFIAAARVLGISRMRLLFRHVLPNIGETLALTTTISISSSILAIASLSFLGLGLQPPAYDWGRMLTEGVNSIYATPAAAAAPAAVIALSALAFGWIGEALARALNPLLWTAARAASSESYLSELARRSSVLQLATQSSPEASGDGEPVLDVGDLIVRFPSARGQVHAVDGISFKMFRGDVVGIVGESGSGKSMTSLALARLVPYPGEVTGTIKINGRDLNDARKVELRQLLGTAVANVYQDPMSSLNPALKVGAQLTEGPREHRGVDRRTAINIAVRGLREVGIAAPEQQLHRYPHELSGGMRQRVMIAMGLTKEPSLLIADEPTTALDVTIQAQIMAVLAEINRVHKTAIILISHNIGLISQNCQRVLVMYAGRIVEDLTVEQLRAPRHPYTRALLSAVPNLRQSRAIPLETIRGQAADSANLPPGCPYHPRCLLAVERCSVELPPLEVGADGGRVACWVANNNTTA